ncbi:MAG: sulfur carrier protein ThiS [Planctomycetes bacterium]|nr:sulfur carrier protein ThiS [Planctomycetota bacterium]
MTGTDPTVAIRLNGEARFVSRGDTIALLLEELGLAGMRLAVERNQRVVPQAEHASARLQDGDEIEVVTFVGGG